MRRNWLASAALAAAITVPGTVLAGTVLAGTVLAGTVLSGTAQAATVTGPSINTRPAVLLASQLQRGRVPLHKRVLRKKTAVTWNMVAATLAKRLVGDRYAYGGTSPAGFDCSGLTQWVYGHTSHGKHIQRTAEEQFLEFRRISHKSARPGDLVFFHVSSDPESYVYHVGVYEGGDDMVAATTYGEGVRLQSFTWGGDTVTFGTITH